MVIISDSREQNPLRLEHLKTDANIECVIVDKLCYGDYSAHSDGKVCPIFYERKSLSDLFGTLGRGYQRFKKEINRCSLDGNRLVIVIEGSVLDILRGYKHSQMSGLGVFRTLCTLYVKYGIQFLCFNDRNDMATYIVETFSAWERSLA
jgi:ERCC4-type nuclease